MDGLLGTIGNALGGLIAGVVGAVMGAIGGVVTALTSIVPAGWLPFVVVGLIVAGLVVIFRR